MKQFSQQQTDLRSPKDILQLPVHIHNNQTNLRNYISPLKMQEKSKVI